MENAGAGSSIVFGQVSSISALSSSQNPGDLTAKPTNLDKGSHSIEELERLGETLKNILIIQQNQLKFLINSRQQLSRQEHSDRVCEAYFESEKTWFAALIQDVDEKT